MPKEKIKLALHKLRALKELFNDEVFLKWCEEYASFGSIKTPMEIKEAIEDFIISFLNYFCDVPQDGRKEEKICYWDDNERTDRVIEEILDTFDNEEMMLLKDYVFGEDFAHDEFWEMGDIDDRVRCINNCSNRYKIKVIDRPAEEEGDE